VVLLTGESQGDNLAYSTLQFRQIWKFGILLAMAIFLSGCEAPLNLAGVEQELAKPIHRYDQFQAAARNDQQMVVVGEAGAVLVSGDNGRTWQRQELPGRPTLIGLALCADGRFVALDTTRRVWLSDHKATDWQARPIETMEAVMALTCDGQNRIWVVAGFSTILSSADGGASWNEESFGDDAQLTSVQFLDESTAYITGEFGMVLKTSDGGINWERLADMPGEFYPQAAHFVDTERGWSVGLNGAILHTSDGGESWQSQDSGVNIPLYGITGVGETLYAVGENGFVLRYAAGSWQAMPHENNILSYLRAASASPDSLLVAGGNGVLFTLASGG
jgi:photosystem II stability/assembly factor-like uncharacterized protein